MKHWVVLFLVFSTQFLEEQICIELFAELKLSPNCVVCILKSLAICHFLVSETEQLRTLLLLNYFRSDGRKGKRAQPPYIVNFTSFMGLGK